jgi:hypothetical protein
MKRPNDIAPYSSISAGEAIAVGWTHRLDINLGRFQPSLELTAS